MTSISNVRTCYMWLANFDKKIKDKHITNVKKMKDLVGSEKDSKKLINKIAKMDYDEKKSKKITATSEWACVPIEMTRI